MGGESDSGALAGFRILDATDGGAQYCGKLLADLGADVVKIEPPGGDFGRRTPPFKGDEPHPEGSLVFAYLNTSKRSLVLDLAQPAGWDTLLRLAATADALIENRALAHDELRAANPRLVITSISPLGSPGPYAGYHTAGDVTFALSGLMQDVGSVDGPPLAPPLDLAATLAAVDAASGTLLALLARRGQVVEVVEREVLTSQIIPNNPQDALRERAGNLYPPLAPSGVYACRDGAVDLTIVMPAQWTRLKEWLGNPPEFAGPEWDNREYRRQHADPLAAWLSGTFADRGQAELVAEGQAQQVPCLPVNTVATFMEAEHTRSRGFFQTVEHAYLGSHPMPRGPFHFSEAGPCPRRPAPFLGQHTDELLHELEAAPAVADQMLGRGPAAPLQGVRVVSFSTAFAGPTLSRYLADFGAEVIKIESRRRPDNTRVASRTAQEPGGISTSLSYGHFNRNKLSLAVDMGREEGRELVRRLLRVTDVVTENFARRVLRGWGLDYQGLRAIRDDIILLDMQGLGQTGVWRDYVTYGPSLQSYSGLTSLWGCSHPFFVDYAAAQHGVVAILAALLHRRRTGRGVHIDLAQYEAAAAMLGTAYLDYAVNGRTLPRAGDSGPAAAFHGAYRCRGNDAWCVIAVASEDQWSAFCRVLGIDRSAAPAARPQGQSELDHKIEEWTRQRDACEVELVMQKAGVPAARIRSPLEMPADPHLQARGFYATVQHPVMGSQTLNGPTIRLSDTPGQVRRAAPLLGQDNSYVLGELLGLPETEIASLQEQGILQ